MSLYFFVLSLGEGVGHLGPTRKSTGKKIVARLTGLIELIELIG